MLTAPRPGTEESLESPILESTQWFVKGPFPLPCYFKHKDTSVWSLLPDWHDKEQKWNGKCLSPVSTVVPIAIQTMYNSYIFEWNSLNWLSGTMVLIIVL